MATWDDEGARESGVCVQEEAEGVAADDEGAAETDAVTAECSLMTSFD